MERKGVIVLDINHPMTTHVFRASHLVGGVTTLAYQMTVASSPIRRQLLQECLPIFDEVRALNQAHFGGSRFIARAIDEYETNVKLVASLGGGQIVEDRRDGEGDCPHCGTKITKIPLTRDRKAFVILCGECARLFRPALEKLDSPQGFGTCFI